MKKIYEDILQNINNHDRYRSKCVNLIASENIMSPMTRRALSSDLGNRYTVGEPNNRLYAGCSHYDFIENNATQLAKKLLHAQYVNVQPVSGMVANMVAYSALLKPNDLIMSLEVKHSGHYSHVKTGMLSLFNVKVESLPFNEKEFSIDLDQASELIKKKKPNVILVGTSEYLFPTPLKELRKVCNETRTKILYDAAHVSGLIVGQTFQDPLSEGADFLTMSTNKTLAAPDHGIVAFNDEMYKVPVEYAVVPLFTSNHHAHHVAGLAVTLAEFEQFGHEYAIQVIKNAQVLARELYEQGIAVLCPHKNFTQSHTVLFDAQMSGNNAMRILEEVNIITNSFKLPWNSKNNATGIRIGTNELTRLGMKEEEMKIIAQFIADALFKRKPLEAIKKEVMNIRKSFQQIYYCFN